ncbi:hypothetical protein H310_14088 [Aphanomyces invadans]|uniref:Uncharacterized protein n=1 Tax=Aphanomyces invadans TaxID=157072 RepID=A0A024TC83_9STRA|nr:hypothetical protein H310_14088 [Aphanomyces invadans]ETV91211.1 hypothetical protein H310_14088 [Aphanomyces invadans]|eukprot:XP_008880048.1 hypothetical protein H310_14088 [Aphanomyces invadans]
MEAMSDKAMNVTADKVLARKARKRAYLRQFMQGYRVKVKDATLMLKAQVRDLEAECARRSFMTMLPWHEIADALQTEQEISETEMRELRRKLRSIEVLSSTMQHWVLTQLNSIPRAPNENAASKSWRNVTLLKDPMSRQLGKDWILQQMYHNTDRMFASHGFPAIASMQSIYEVDVQTEHVGDSDCMYYHAKRQMESPPPDAIMRYMYRNKLCSIIMADGDIPVTYPTIREVTRTTALHQLTTSKGEWFNVLVGEFNSPTRCVIVAQQIEDDEVYRMVGTRQRNRMMWYDFQRMPSGRWMYRSLYINSQTFVQDGSYAPLDVEAQDIGVDHNPLNAATFRQLIRTRIRYLYDMSSDVFRHIYMDLLVSQDPLAGIDR